MHRLWVEMAGSLALGSPPGSGLIFEMFKTSEFHLLHIKGQKSEFMTHWSTCSAIEVRNCPLLILFSSAVTLGALKHVVPKDIGAAGSWLCWQAGEVSVKLERSSHLFLAGAFL